MTATRILLLLLVLIVGPLRAATPVVLTADRHEYVLSPHLDLLPDPLQQYAIDAVSGPAMADLFAPSQGTLPSLGFDTPSAWVRFTLTNNAALNKDWVLVMKWHGYDLIELYIPEPSAAPHWRIVDSADTRPFSERDIPHRYQAFNLPLAPGQTRTFYLRLVMDPGEVAVPLLLWSKEAFRNHDRNERLALGIYYGIIAVMTLYNLFLFFSLRDRSYLYYVIMTLTAGIWFATFNGIAQEYYWPDDSQGIWTYYRAYPLLVHFNWIWVLLFVQTFLQTKLYAPRIHRILSSMIWMASALAIAALVGLVHYSLPYQAILFLAEWVFVLVAGIVSWRRGFHPARYFLIAWTTMIGGACLLILSILGVVPSNFLTTNALQIGHALEVLLLSLALANRINILREEKEHEEEIAREAQLRAQAVEKELQIAQELQMELMPTSSPAIAGLDIAGRCLPAALVGGDFFQYYQRDDTLSFCLADVTGHAMGAAVPVMMFSGVLETEMQYGHPVEELLAKLNHLLHRKLDDRTFVCFALGELHLTTRILRLANVGCPPAYHFHHATGQVAELVGEGYPLGVQPESTYTADEVPLESGDWIIFCSDGLVETANEQEEIFGYDQMIETIRQACVANLAAEGLIDKVFHEVQGYAGEVPQEDDMTCLALRVE